MKEIHRPIYSSHKVPIMQKACSCHDVIMIQKWNIVMMCFYYIIGGIIWMLALCLIIAWHRLFLWSWVLTHWPLGGTPINLCWQFSDTYEGQMKCPCVRQCWPRSLSPDCVTRPMWVKHDIPIHENNWTLKAIVKWKHSKASFGQSFINIEYFIKTWCVDTCVECW